MVGFRRIGKGISEFLQAYNERQIKENESVWIDRGGLNTFDVFHLESAGPDDSDAPEGLCLQRSGKKYGIRDMVGDNNWGLMVSRSYPDQKAVSVLPFFPLPLSILPFYQ
jgi:hypothetical protein